MKCFFLAVISLAVAHTLSFGQITITALMTGNGIDFTGYEAVGDAVDNAGLLPGGNGGKGLDSDDWRFDGFNTGASTA